MQNATENSANKPYKQILKSTFIMGGSSVIVTMLAIVRTKFIALILGPTGVGLTGIYMNITNLVTIFSGMGIGESGMRQIAGAAGTGNNETIARTVLTIRRASLLSGVVGLCMLLFMSSGVSRFTFGTSDHKYDIAILSATIFFGAVSLGRRALIQGVRRIGDLAKLDILAAIFGTVLSIPVVYYFGERGIVYTLLTVSATAIATSWWYCQKIKMPAVTLSLRESLSEAGPLVRLGLALMLGSLISLGVQYVLRVIVVRYEGLSAAGIYHAATTLSLLYVGVILNAMLTDFYPCLSAAAHDHEECSSLINKQVEVGLLFVVPGVLAIMTFAPLIIVIFYSSQFVPAVEILRWQILGGVLQAVTWPMGLLIRAQGNGKLVFWTELYAGGIQLGLAWLGIALFGLPGIGISFFGRDLFYLLLMYWIVRNNYKFAFSNSTRQVFAISAFATAIVFIVPFFLAKEMSLLVNAGIIILAAIYAVKALISKARIEETPGLLFKIKMHFGF